MNRQFQIFVTDGKFGTTTLDVKPNMTIGTLKKLYLEKRPLGLPVALQRMIYKGKQLINSQQIGNVGINKESTVYIAMQAGGVVEEETEFLDAHLQNFKNELIKCQQENILVCMNLSTHLVNYNRNITNFESQIMNLDLISYFQHMHGIQKFKLFLFNPIYLIQEHLIKTVIQKITQREHRIEEIDSFLCIKDPEEILDVYISKFNLNHLTNLAPNAPNSSFTKFTLFNYLNDPELFDNLNIFYKLYNNQNYYLKLKNNRIEEFRFDIIKKVLNGGKKKKNNYYKMKNGGKKIIKTGPKGGKYYINNGKKNYIK